MSESLPQTARGQESRLIDNLGNLVTVTNSRLDVNANIASLPLPSGAATSANQDTQIMLATTLNALTTTLNSLVDSNNELIARLTFLVGARGTAADLRVTMLTGGTLSTVTGLTNIGGYSAFLQTLAQQNQLAIQSNIQNVAIT